MKTIPIALSCNRKYLPHALAVCMSVAEHTDSPLSFYLLTGMDVSVGAMRKFAAVFNGDSRISVEFIRPLERGIDFRKSNPFTWSLEAFHRLAIPLLFPQYDRMIYLDCDVLVRTDLAPMLELPLDGRWIGACHHPLFRKCFDSLVPDPRYGMTNREYYTKIAPVDPDRYICSGVLLWDLAAIRRSADGIARFQKVISEPINFWTVDEDVLNVYFREQIHILPDCWGHFIRFASDADLPDNEVVHAIYKPWLQLFDSAGGEYYWSLLRRTPFYYETAARNLLLYFEKKVNHLGRPAQDNIISACIKLLTAFGSETFLRVKQWICRRKK